MSKQQPNNQLHSAYKKYKNLSSNEKFILKFLSVIYLGIDEHNLKIWIEKYGEFSEPLNFTEVIEKFSEHNLIEKHYNEIKCNKYLIDIIAKEISLTGEFEYFSNILFHSGFNDFFHSEEEKFLYLLRLGIYGKNPDDILQLIDSYQGSDKNYIPYQTQLIIKDIALDGFCKKWFDNLPDSIKVIISIASLTEAIIQLLPLDKNQIYLENYLRQESNHDEQVASFFYLFSFLRNPETKKPAILNKKNHSINAIIEFLQGNIKTSLENFEKSLKNHKKNTGKKKICLHGLYGVFHLAALIINQNEKTQLKARELAELYPKEDQTIHGLQFAYIIKYIADHYSALRNHDDFINIELKKIEPFYRAFYTLCQHLINSDLSENNKNLEILAKKSMKAGWLWNAWSIENAILSYNNKYKPNLSSNLYNGNFFTITKTEEPWLLGLSILQKIAKEEGCTGLENSLDKRLVWVLNNCNWGLNFVPKLQSKSSNGWGKGREISLDRLIKDAKKIKEITKYDRPLIEAAKKINHGHWQSNSSWHLDPDLASIAAIGHPNMYWEDDCENPISFIKQDVALNISETNDNFIISLNTSFDGQRPVKIDQIEPHKILVYQCHPFAKKMLSALPKNGLIIPKSAKGDILKTISDLSPYITIHSDLEIEDQEIINIKTNSTIQVRIQQLDEGFRFSSYVQPFGDKGPIFRPGEGKESVLLKLENSKIHTKRELQTEQRNLKVVAEKCFFETKNTRNDWYINDLELVLESLASLKELDKSIKLKWLRGKPIKIENELSSKQMKISITKKTNWFAIEGQIKINENEVFSLKEILKLLGNSKGRFLELDDGRYLTLKNSLLLKLNKISNLIEGDKFHALSTPAMEEATTDFELVESKSWRAHTRKIHDLKNFHPKVPSNLQAELRDYQEEGFKWLSRLSHLGAGACLADDMGLGKTVQALGLILERAPTGPTLVIAPTSVCFNWIEEAKKFAPSLSRYLITAGDDFKKLSSLGPYDLLVTSYGLLTSQTNFLKEIKWETLVLDEAQAIKNSETKRFKAAYELKSSFKMITTGTPIENNLSELWSLFKFINPGLLGTKKHFEHKFSGPIENEKSKIASKNLKSLIKPFILRRLKNHVLDELPPKTDILLKIEMGVEESNYYEALRQSSVERIKEEESKENKNQFVILSELTKLRQAACNSRLLQNDSVIGSAKLDTFKTIVADLIANKHKALVFSQFVSHLRIIREYLDENNISYQYLDGSTSQPVRKSSVMKFQQGEGDLFLISLKAGGFGINLTNADYVIHLDPWWNPAVEDQATDRAHRMGQEKPVTVYRLVTKGTIEEKIVKLHRKKKNLAESLLSGAEMSSQLSTKAMVDLIQSH